MGVPALAQLLTLSAGANALPNLPPGLDSQISGADFAALLAEMLPAELATPEGKQATSDPVEPAAPESAEIATWLLPPGFMAPLGTPKEITNPALTGMSALQSPGSAPRTIQPPVDNIPENYLASTRPQTPKLDIPPPEKLSQRTELPSELPSELHTENNSRQKISELLVSLPQGEIRSEKSGNLPVPADGREHPALQNSPATGVDKPWLAIPNGERANWNVPPIIRAGGTPRDATEESLPAVAASTAQPSLALPSQNFASPQINTGLTKPPETSDQPRESLRRAIERVAGQDWTSSANRGVKSESGAQQPELGAVEKHGEATQTRSIAPSSEQFSVPAPNREIASETEAKPTQSTAQLIGTAPYPAPTTMTRQPAAPDSKVTREAGNESPSTDKQPVVVSQGLPPPELAEQAVESHSTATDFHDRKIAKHAPSSGTGSRSEKEPAHIAIPAAADQPVAPKPEKSEEIVSDPFINSGEEQSPRGQAQPAVPAAEPAYIAVQPAPPLMQTPAPSPESRRPETESIAVTPRATDTTRPDTLPAQIGKNPPPAMPLAAKLPPENAAPPATDRTTPADAANIAGKTTPSNDHETEFVAMLTAARASDTPLPAPAQTAIAPPLHDQQWGQNLGEKIVWLAKSDQQSAQIHINPPQLGPVQVTLNLSGDQASIAFTSPHGEVRQAIQDAMPQLREMLSAAGINLGQANVGSQQSQAARDFAWQFANENRSVGENAILPAENRAAQSNSGLMIQRGRGLVDLFA